jgi:hypothetical protein
MKAIILKNYLEMILEMNKDAEVRIDFGLEEMKEYSSNFNLRTDDLGDILIYEKEE